MFDLTKDEYLQLYLEEAFEKTQELGHHLLLLEKNKTDNEVIQVIFRCAHTLKGNSTTVYNTILDIDSTEITLPQIDKIAKLTDAFENVFMEVRDNDFPLTQTHIDLLLVTEEAIETLLNYIALGSDEEVYVEDLHMKLKESIVTSPVLPETSNDIIKENDFAEEGHRFELKMNYDSSFKHAYLSLVYREIEEEYPSISFNPTPKQLWDGDKFEQVFIEVFSESTKDSIVDFLEMIDYVEAVIPLDEMDQEYEVEAETEQMALEEKFAMEEQKLQAAVDLSLTKEEPKTSPHTTSTNTTIKVKIERVDEVLKHVSNLVILKNKLLNFANNANLELTGELKETAEEISHSVELLQDSVMKIRMTPLDQLFSRFPIDVRRISKEKNKNIVFEQVGGETEIDKSLMDKLGEPLMHLIRNSVDHGIESEEERVMAGKSPAGTIKLSAKHEKNEVVIVIEDDGGGIDIEKVVNKAIARGILTEEKARSTSHSELVNLIFHPGLSTAEQVTTISGRGVGMDVVRSKISDDMKGQIEIETAKGVGTKTIIRLPLTLAIINAMLTKIAGDVFAFPSNQVESVEEIKVSDIHYISNKEIYILKERNLEVPIIRLDQFFGLTSTKNNDATLNLLILKSGTKMVGATVDEFMEHEDIVLKTVGKYLGNVPGIGGCNVLGNGDVSLIVDVHSICNLM